MKTSIAKWIAVALVSGMIIAGGVSALAGPQAAAPSGTQPAGLRPIIRNTTDSTTLTIKRKPKGTVHKGTTIKFRGKLSSSNAACVPGQTIQLYKSAKLVATTTTSSTGGWSAKKKVRKTSQFTARFPGSQTGVHPNITTCLSSASKTIKVKVG